jgi:hypothetical protein
MDAGEAKAAEAAEIDDRIDTLCRGFLGLTAACARCHDHKFDPIPTKDYYALAGVIKSSKYQEALLAPADVIEKYNEGQARVRDEEAKVKQLLDAEGIRLAEGMADDTARYVLAAWKLQNARKTNPQAATADAAKKDKLRDFVLDRWVKYLFEKGSEARPTLAGWRQAVAGLDAGKDLSADAAALEKVTTAAGALQSDVLAALKARDAGGKLEPAQADLLKDIVSPQQGVCRVDPNQVEKMLDDKGKQALAKVKQEVEEVKKVVPAKPPVAHSITEGTAEDMHVYVRGNVKKEGDVVGRHFLTILAGDEPPRFTQGSGRLELAKAIADPKNPLTARVMVNRIWQHHFGRGLVATPSNFGRLGQRPSHPELLDHLAARFVANGWSIKALHREILLSATYQLASDYDEADAKVDPADLWLWRMPRRRLDVEAWRDSLLTVSGNLDAKVGGPSLDLAAGNNHRRTLYAAVSRHSLNGMLRLFDFPDPNLTSEARTATTVPLQQLFVLNSDFMVTQARALVKRLAAEEKDDAGRIRRAYLLLYGRPATDAEVKLGLDFLAVAGTPAKPGEAAPGLSAWEQYAQVLLGDNEFTFID